MQLLSPALVQAACHPDGTRWGQGTWLRCGRTTYRDRRSPRVAVVFPTKAEAVKWVERYEAGRIASFPRRSASLLQRFRSETENTMDQRNWNSAPDGSAPVSHTSSGDLGEY